MQQTTKIHKWLLRFDRTFSEGLWKQIMILGGFFLIVLILGVVICRFLPFGKQGVKLPFYEWAVYLFIDGNALSNLYLDEYTEGGRSWVISFAVFCSVLGIVIFGGMLISVLSNMLERRVENYRTGKNVYVTSGHYIVLGYDEIVPSIIKQICNNKDAYVLLQSSMSSEEVAGKLQSSIAQDCLARVIIKNGHRTSVKDLAELRLNKSYRIFIVGDRTNPMHDAINIDCMEKLYMILNSHKKDGIPESITTVFEEQETYAALQVADLFNNIRSLGIEFTPYNFYVNWAKQMFVDCCYTDSDRSYKYPYLDGNGITSLDKRHVHLVIVGISNFGVTLGIEAAKMLHFPNFKKGENITRITFIDLNADKERNLFMTRYRHFFEIQSHLYEGERCPATKFEGENADFLDVEFEFVKGDVYSQRVQELMARWATDENQLLSLIFAMRDSRHNMAIAMNLPDEVYEKAIPVFIRQNTSSKFLSILHMKTNRPEKKIIVEANEIKELSLKGRYANLYPFGMTDIVIDVDKQAQRMAEGINHIYTVCKKKNWEIPQKNEVINCSWDEIHKKWIALEVAHQWSNLYSAYNIEYRIHAIKAMRNNNEPIKQITNEEAEIIANVEHNRWNVEKLLLGYRKPSESEDANAPVNYVNGMKSGAMKEAHKALFIHSDIRPFSSLDQIQTIDKEIVRYIPWLQDIAKSNSYN